MYATRYSYLCSQSDRIAWCAEQFPYLHCISDSVQMKRALATFHFAGYLGQDNMWDSQKYFQGFTFIQTFLRCHAFCFEERCRVQHRGTSVLNQLAAGEPATAAAYFMGLVGSASCMCKGRELIFPNKYLFNYILFLRTVLRRPID